MRGATAALAAMTLVVLPVQSATGTSDSEPGRGTGEGWIRAVDVHVGDTLRAAIVQSEAQATLDAGRVGAPEDRAYREFVAGLVEAGDQSTPIPDPPKRVESSESDEGDDEEDTGSLVVEIPGATTEAIREALDGAPAAQRLGTVGQDGWVASGTVTPSRARASFYQEEGGDVFAALNVGGMTLLDGLTELADVGPGEIGASTSEVTTTASNRGLQIGRVTLLDLDALLALTGLGGVADLADDTLATLSDAMVLGLAFTGGDVSPYGTWSAAVAAAEQVIADLEDALAGGLACLGLDASLVAAVNDLFATVGRDPVDCLLGVLVADLLEDAQEVLTEFVTAMRDGLDGQALLEIHDVGGSTSVESGIDEDGQVTTRAEAWGEVGTVLVAGEDIGGFATDTATSLRQQLEDRVDEALADVTAALGPEYEDMVTVDLLPVHEESVDDTGEYVLSAARVALMIVHVTPPGTAPVATSDLVSDLNGQGPDVRSTTAAAMARTGPVDLRDAEPVAAVHSAEVRAQALPQEPVSIVVGQLLSGAEHTRPSDEDTCESDCDPCHGSECDGGDDPCSGSSCDGNGDGDGDGDGDGEGGDSGERGRNSDENAGGSAPETVPATEPQPAPSADDETGGGSSTSADGPELPRTGPASVGGMTALGLWLIVAGSGLRHGARHRW